MTSTLATLPFGEPAVIEAIAGERGFRRRLLELGFLPGSQARVLAAAPMGDPLDVEVGGCRFSLRKAEAASITVTGLAALAAK
jgi:Fe2+ transport system protein FeoA